tara:strand:- start:38 stop:1255 length:1218 start_codon:yes stop_codon:yes gene_type:complete
MIKKTLNQNIVNSVNGIRLSSVYSGMYNSERLDLSLIEIQAGSSVSGVFTKNNIKSPSVLICEKNLNKKNPRYLIINSGNANAGTGKKGYQDAVDYCTFLSKATLVDINEILPFSTGIIGERIKVKEINKSIPLLVDKLNKDSWEDFSKAILTTDTCSKIVSKLITLSDEDIIITGVAKGSGMIQPNMATMLSFVATNLEINKNTLNNLLNTATNVSYNMITVDGETSTNDSSILISTGKSNLKYDDLSQTDQKIFQKTLNNIYIDLAKKIISDGEGATKFITINVKNIDTQSNGKKIAMSVANSPLVKTALFAEDPNWGRILSAIGSSETKISDYTKIEISFDDILIYKDGGLHQDYKEDKAKNYLKNKNIIINIDFNIGIINSTVWTTDLSYDYIKINADYRT